MRFILPASIIYSVLLACLWLHSEIAYPLPPTDISPRYIIYIYDKYRHQSYIHIFDTPVYIRNLACKMCQYHNSKAIISPSILSADFTNLGSDVIKLFQNGSDWIHIDIMDGHFVPNISIGLPVIEQLRQLLPESKFFFDCHMMVENPENWVEKISKFGGNQFTFHLETTSNPRDLINLIKSYGMRASCAIKPHTLIDEGLIELIPQLDMVLIMTVEPGFGGQKFMEDMMDKVTKLRSVVPPGFNIQVDGGLNMENVDTAAKAGANVIVAGTSVFKTKDQGETIKYLRDRVNREFKTKL